MAKNKDLFKLQDAGFDMGVNVRVTKRDKKTLQVIEERRGHNRALRMTLMALTKFLNGEFNLTATYIDDRTKEPIYYPWIPRYLGVGTNEAGPDSPEGITTEVTVNDTRLLNEIYPRVPLPERNKIVNRSTQNYIQLVISTYLPETYYNGYEIKEAGLFGKETGNNCLFRITFDPIKKTEDSVVQVEWTITIISVESNNSPYKEIDKTDLREAMNTLLDRFVELYPALSQAANHIKEPAIYDYGRSDVSQDKVNEDVELLGEDLANLKDLNPDEYIQLIDEINGEVI